MHSSGCAKYYSNIGRLAAAGLSERVIDATRDDQTSPFGKVVLVGYQRPAFMSGMCVHVFKNGS